MKKNYNSACFIDNYFKRKHLCRFHAHIVKQGQSIHQICVNNADEIMVDERTIYNYIDNGILSVRNLDLPRKVRYKKRKAKRR